MAFALHISENSKPWQVIEMIAAEQHITLEMAAERLLEEAAQLHLKPKDGESANAEYLEHLRKRSLTRAEARRVAGDPKATIGPEAPDALIGFLADAPEVAQAIRDLAYERRSRSYGTSPRPRLSGGFH
jgi:ribosomal protein S12 methylthiotransferase accessory factor YcaO